METQNQKWDGCLGQKWNHRLLLGAQNWLQQKKARSHVLLTVQLVLLQKPVSCFFISPLFNFERLPRPKFHIETLNFFDKKLRLGNVILRTLLNFYQRASIFSKFLTSLMTNRSVFVVSEEKQSKRLPPILMQSEVEIEPQTKSKISCEPSNNDQFTRYRIASFLIIRNRFLHWFYTLITRAYLLLVYDHER